MFSCMSFFGVLLWILKGLYGLFWHYSPLDREEVAMYGGRALVGLQQCRVSSQDEKRERG